MKHWVDFGRTSQTSNRLTSLAGSNSRQRSTIRRFKLLQLCLLKCQHIAKNKWKYVINKLKIHPNSGENGRETLDWGTLQSQTLGLLASNFRRSCKLPRPPWNITKNPLFTAAEFNVSEVVVAFDDVIVAFDDVIEVFKTNEGFKILDNMSIQSPMEWKRNLKRLYCFRSKHLNV